MISSPSALKGAVGLILTLSWLALSPLDASAEQDKPGLDPRADAAPTRLYDALERAIENVDAIANARAVTSNIETCLRNIGIEGRAESVAPTLPGAEASELVAMAYSNRDAGGFYSEAGISQISGPGVELIEGAAVDMILGATYARLQAQTNEEAPDDAIEREWIGRAWCQTSVANSTALEVFMDEHGFPGAASYGEPVSSAALFVVKHADARPELVARYTAQAETAFARGEMNGVNYALLLDGIAVDRGEPQLYGSYMECHDDGPPTFVGGVVDEARIEDLRAEIGMFPLAFQRPQVEASCALP